MKMNGLEEMLKKSFPDDDKTLSDRDIDKEKEEFISLIKNYKKDDLIPKPQILLEPSACLNSTP